MYYNIVSFDATFFLVLLTLITGILLLFDILYKGKIKDQWNINTIFIHAKSFFPVLLIILIIRSFIVQPYKVPTGSLSPTIIPVEFILVNQFAYGLKLPILNINILNIGEPKRGDLVLFRYPKNPKILFVKRVIGLPGDNITYYKKILKINGEITTQLFQNIDLDMEGEFPKIVKVKIENLNGLKHKIFIRDEINKDERFDIIVPNNFYFMMGDNRDSSNDSRHWGFVPKNNLVGKAFAIWMSWDQERKIIRWERIGKIN